MHTSVLIFLGYGEKRSILSFLGLRYANRLNWLCTWMSYCIFMNLGELIQGYFVSKIKEGSASIFSIVTATATKLHN